MLVVGDCIEIPLENQSVDLVFGSPPYEARRTYGIGFTLQGQEWVDWCVPRFRECLRVCRGLVAWVVGHGTTRQYRWSAAPTLLEADLFRIGACLRNPPVFSRIGIPGSGGPDWLRADHERIVCATAKQGRLPWSAATAMGHAPKYEPGGAPSHRLQNGKRKVQTRRKPNGERLRDGEYVPPVKANPGNVIHGNVGKGHMGDDLAHENEAPFPEWLAEFFIKSFCPPGGIVLDPFCGSGTTLAVAKKIGRSGYGMDIRQSQIELTERRLAGIETGEVCS